jgi:DNA repair protein RadC
MASTHDGHRARLKEEFRQGGLNAFPPHRVLELMLFYCIPRIDTNEIAHGLIDRFGSLSGVLDAPFELLCETPGVSRETALYLKLASSVIRLYMEDMSSDVNSIRDTETAKRYIQGRFVGETSENLYLTGMGANGKIIFNKLMAEGSPDNVTITPSTVVKAALRVDASKVMLAHNHPRGFCIPSNADYRTTQILYKELRRVDVELFDHVIVASDGVCSMREMGMIPPAE